MHQPRLFTRLREAIRLRHHGCRREKSCLRRSRRCVRVHGLRPPRARHGRCAGALTHLAVIARVATTTQVQAPGAIPFLHRPVLGRDTGWIDAVVRGRERVRVPVVLAPEEAARVLAHMRGQHALVTSALCAAGPRLGEGLGLRGKNAGFPDRQLCIRRGKGREERVTVMPDAVIRERVPAPPLRHRIATHPLGRGGRDVRSPLDLREPRLAFAA